MGECQHKRVTLVSAAPASHGDLTVALLIEGQQTVHVMSCAVASALAGYIVKALGSSLLYNAGLERAAQIADLAAARLTMAADPRDDLASLAIEIRDCKVGKSR